MGENFAGCHGLAGRRTARDDHVEPILDAKGQRVVDHAGCHNCAQLFGFFLPKLFEFAFLAEQKRQFDVFEGKA